MKRLFIGKLSCTVLATLLLGCSGEEKEMPAQVPMVKSEIVVLHSDKNMHSYIGVAEGSIESSMSFSVMERIRTVNVDDGIFVHKGDLLATLDCTVAKNAMEAANSSLQRANDAYRRMKQLYDNNSLPEIKMIEISTQLEQAKSSYEIAVKNYNDCFMYAPYDGVVGKVYHNIGENVMPGEMVLKILKIDDIKVKVSIPESEIKDIGINSLADVSIKAVGNDVFHGKIMEKGYVSNPVTRTYDVYVMLDNDEHKIMPGMICSVGMGYMADSCLLVPVNSVHRDNNDSLFVWKITDGKAYRSYVRIGKLRGNDIEVYDGLSSGDRIITDGYQKISNGSKILYR